jgi:hypothetical protein
MNRNQRAIKTHSALFSNHGNKPIQDAMAKCLVMLIVLVGCVCAGQENEPVPVFVQTDSGYHVTWVFTAACNADSALNVLFSYTQLKQYLPDITLALDSIEEHPGWNRLRYKYSYLIYSLRITFLRQLNDSTGSVDFAMENAVPSSQILPVVRRITGQYKVIPKADSVIIEYRQATQFDRHLLGLQMAVIKYDTRAALHRQYRYLLQTRKQ